MLTEDGKANWLAQDVLLDARIKEFKAEQKALLNELGLVGIHVDMVNRLTMMLTEKYTAATPILLSHLHRIDDYSEGARDSIARSVAVKDAAIDSDFPEEWRLIMKINRR